MIQLFNPFGAAFPGGQRMDSHWGAGVIDGRPRIIRFRSKAALRALACILAMGMLPCPGTFAATEPDSAETNNLWSAHIEPLLKDRCFECHNPTKSKSGLDLTSLQTILRGGDRGAAVIPGRPDDSNLYKFLRSDADPHMPPGNRTKLAGPELELIHQWIEQLGASASAPGKPEEPESHGPAAAAQTRIRWRPPADMPPSKAVDRFLERAWKLDRVTAAAPATDRTFVRRLYLDLAGRIPTQAELERFLRDPAREKRTRLIDDLLAGEEYPRHMREVFDPVLMERRGPRWEEERAEKKWFSWLEDAFARNRPWDEVVRDMIVARPGRPEDRGAVWFLYERENNAQAIAEALAPVVFGVQVKCAQCHDHMVAREIKQAHYWGMVSAFNRSKNVNASDGPALSESAIGGFVSFANLKKESQQARLVFFNGRTVDEAWPKDGEKEQDLPEFYLVPPPPGKGKSGEPAVPKFSRRTAFADAVTRDNPLLARAMVNRVWAILFGRGLVHPVDLMDSKHPASHPELLDWLARDFERSGFDVKRLVRTLCQTRAYQCGARPAKPSKTAPPPPESFARALDKPLSAEQLFRSLLIATGSQVDTNGLIAGKSESQLRRAFVKQFPDLFPAEYNATLQQAMFFSNAELFDNLLAPREGNLTAHLASLTENRARVLEAYAAVFGREPDAMELRTCSEYLQPRPAEAGMKQLLWAMLTSAEFQLNH